MIRTLTKTTAVTLLLAGFAAQPTFAQDAMSSDDFGAFSDESFDGFDSDGDGLLNTDEFDTIGLGNENPADDYDYSFGGADTDGDGSVSQEEYRDAEYRRAEAEGRMENDMYTSDGTGGDPFAGDDNPVN